MGNLLESYARDGEAGLPEDAARQALSKEWVEWAVRFGHAAKGAVFGAIGVLAARMAFADSDEAPDFPGALEALADQPLEFVFLTVLALGLLSYAAWRFAYGLADPDPDQGGPVGLAKRGAMFGVGLTYLAFGVYAVALMFGLRRDNGGVEDETATILAWPGGPWIVGLVAGGVIVAGLHELWVAVGGRYREEFSHVRMSTWERSIAVGAGWAGHAARGAIYCVAGIFGVRAAVTYDPTEARGFADTLREIAEGPLGGGLLVLVAAGLIAFGIYSFMLALHRHIPDESGRIEDRMP
jgi:hypothetical protein